MVKAYGLGRTRMTMGMLQRRGRGIWYVGMLIDRKGCVREYNRHQYFRIIGYIETETVKDSIRSKREGYC